MPGENDNRDKRRYPRVPTNIPVFIRHDSAAHGEPISGIIGKKAVIKDISEGGMLILYEPEKAEAERNKPARQTFILEEPPLEIAIMMDPNNNKLYINLEAVPLWAEVNSGENGSSVKIGISYTLGMTVKPIASGSSVGLFFNIPVAEEEIFKIIQQFPRTVDATSEKPGYQATRHYYRGTLFESIGEYNQALGELKSALDLGFENAELHNRLGRIYIKQGNPGQAAFEFNRALELDPFNQQAKSALTVLRKKNIT
jgi:tetratricopeptide (TPR) repeat protein